jgi:predicted unusual protein kinase regulating ubiquinone biosynthesis (AarF/ABC1/UbiB family)
MKMADTVPRGKLARTAIAGGAILKAGSKQLTHAAKRPFLSETARQAQQQRLDDETARILFQAFSQLRGTALKLAQMLSMESNLMPEWFRREMTKSYHQVPPLGRPLVRKQILEAFYGLHALHADPNPGNYLFADDGTLGLLDFGCVRYYSADFVKLVPLLMNAYRERNAQRVISTYQRLGMVAEMTGDELQAFYEQILQPFGDWLTRPFKVERFNFANQGNAYTAEGLALFGQLVNVRKINDIAREFIYFDRTLFGLYQLFERMGACINMQHQWLA